jgi:hypothetical protein
LSFTAQSPVATPARDYIHPLAQEVFQILNQRDMVQQAAAEVEVDQEIEVAIGTLVAGDDGAEHAEVAGAVASRDAQNQFALLPDFVEAHAGVHLRSSALTISFLYPNYSNQGTQICGPWNGYFGLTIWSIPGRMP